MYKLAISDMSKEHVQLYIVDHRGYIYLDGVCSILDIFINDKEILFKYTNTHLTVAYTTYNTVYELRDAIIIHLALNTGSQYLKYILSVVEDVIHKQTLNFKEGQ